MYQPTFKEASIWAILWRSALALLGVTLFAGLLMGLFNFQFLAFISILTDGLLYFAFYKITLRQMERQSLSTEALSEPGPKNKKAILSIFGITLLLALMAFTFIQFILTSVSFIPPLFDIVMPYVMDVSFAEVEISYIYIFVTAVIFAPLVEEVVFRGYLMNKWVDKYGLNKGIWFSSLIFMIVHFQSLFIPQLLLGLFCAIIYAKYNNLFYPIIAHALYNLFVILPAMLTPEPNAMDLHFEMMTLSNLVDERPVEYLVISAVFIICLMVFFFIGRRIMLSIKGTNSPYTENLRAETTRTAHDDFDHIEF
ncbi:hypothetical protein GCM10008932_23620 [Alkalibacterium iburiense]|uniref:CAAX prenyl protease 2/Lysostaphin resistance protein A-like domain-containing protein n=1 Tax=Alkalibacterium iburiense TaxID=290589 RepID=A0ABN0XSE9_9LACT